MLFRFLITSFFLVAVSSLNGALSQTASEQRLIDRVVEAEAAFKHAKTVLARERSQGQPIIAKLEALTQQQSRLRAEMEDAYTAYIALRDIASKVPSELEQRRSRLSNELIRLYRSNGSASEIRKREVQLADVKSQIEALESEDTIVRRQHDRAYAKYDAVFKQLRNVDDQVSLVASRASQARLDIRAAERALADARDELERARSSARWSLNDDPPPILQQVQVGRGRQIFYDAEWVGDQEDAEHLLRLAQYLHEDLSRSLELREALVESWIEILTEDQRTANAALENYTRMLGGSYSSGVMMYVERGLDAVTGGYGGALVTGGSLTWKKIAVELADAGYSIFNDISSGVPPHTAVFTEATFQLLELAWNGGDKNPSWDLSQMPMPTNVVTSSSGNITIETTQRILASIDAHSVRATLERMKDQVEGDLESENFRDTLFQTHGSSVLASAFTEATFTKQTPDLNIDERGYLGKSPIEWGFSQLYSPTGVMKSLMKEAMFNDPIARRNGKAVWDNALQAAIKDGILEQLERQRLEAWEAWLEADAEVQFSTANLRNAGRLRRMDQKIQRVLADEVIPQLTREVESRRGTRTLRINKDAGVKGEKATLLLTFSGPVTLTEVTLQDQVLELIGADESWQAELNLKDFEESSAQLKVEVRHPAFEDLRLDDPRTVATWSSQTKRFNSYEKEDDISHVIRLEPPSGTAYALVLDTSGSMNEDGNNRIGAAKLALSDFLQSGRVSEEDQVGLFTFSGCRVNQSVPFTNDLQAVQTGVNSAGAYGDTPLAASIVQAAASLEAQNVERGILIVVTDGADSCNGSVPAAFETARNMVDGIRRRIIR